MTDWQSAAARHEAEMEEWHAAIDRRIAAERAARVAAAAEAEARVRAKSHRTPAGRTVVAHDHRVCAVTPRELELADRLIEAWSAGGGFTSLSEVAAAVGATSDELVALGKWASPTVFKLRLSVRGDVALAFGEGYLGGDFESPVIWRGYSLPTDAPAAMRAESDRLWAMAAVAAAAWEEEKDFHGSILGHSLA